MKYFAVNLTFESSVAAGDEAAGFSATQLTAAFLLTKAASGCTSGVRLHGGMRKVSFA